MDALLTHDDRVRRRLKSILKLMMEMKLRWNMVQYIHQPACRFIKYIGMMFALSAGLSFGSIRCFGNRCYGGRPSYNTFGGIPFPHRDIIYLLVINTLIVLYIIVRIVHCTYPYLLPSF